MLNSRRNLTGPDTSPYKASFWQDDPQERLIEWLGRLIEGLGDSFERGRTRARTPAAAGPGGPATPNATASSPAPPAAAGSAADDLRQAHEQSVSALPGIMRTAAETERSARKARATDDAAERRRYGAAPAAVAGVLAGRNPRTAQDAGLRVNINRERAVRAAGHDPNRQYTRDVDLEGMSPAEMREALDEARTREQAKAQQRLARGEAQKAARGGKPWSISGVGQRDGQFVARSQVQGRPARQGSFASADEAGEFAQRRRDEDLASLTPEEQLIALLADTNQWSGTMF